MRLRGATAALIEGRGGADISTSLSHDGGGAVAFVVLAWTAAGESA